jgi:hypothetical protein
LDLEDPDGPQRPKYSAAENSALAAYHKQVLVLEKAVFGEHVGGGGGGSGASGGQSGGSGAGGAGRTDSESEVVKKLRQEVDRLKSQIASSKKGGGSSASGSSTASTHTNGSSGGGGG